MWIWYQVFTSIKPKYLSTIIRLNFTVLLSTFIENETPLPQHNCLN